MTEPQPGTNEPKPAEAFIEHMGRVSQADGLPRIAGRLFGFLILYGGPYSLTELAQHLSVSRGSVSTNTRLLEQLGIAVRVSRPGNRQDYYQLHPAPYPALLRGVVQRTRNAQEGVTQARQALPEAWGEAKDRLEALETFYTRVQASAESVIRSYDGHADHAHE